MPRPGEHYVIVGGTRGLGHQLAQAVAAAGASVTITGRSAESGRTAAEAVGAACQAATCDLTDWPSIEEAFRDLPTIDHLILCALDRDQNTVAEFRPDDAAQTSLMKNVGYAAAVHYALPKFSPTGSVVMFSGISMWRPFPGSMTISMANAGVIGLMNSLATQIAPVRVNSITPGVIGGTDAFDQADPIRRAAFEAMLARTPGRRLPTPDEVVAATFALTDNAGINGSNLVVDGGMTLM
jgi:NAD(P)-dependent dehydrogenase (short-subunit alcohol dehydrogenase family)